MTSTLRLWRTRTATAALSLAGLVLTQGAVAGPAAAVDSTTYLSSLPTLSAVSAWGPMERDRSNGGLGARDGRTLTLNGQTFARGLGVHAPSDVRFRVPASCTAFRSTVGVDDEVGSRGSVVFKVYRGTTKVYDSGRRTGTSANATVSVPVAGGNLLRLVVTDAGDGRAYDHGDWASARLSCTAPAPTPTSSVVLRETFTGPDGTFVSSGQFWGSSDRGASRNPTWFAESGSMRRTAGTGRVTFDQWNFRMYTRQNDLSHVTVNSDIRFNGWYGGSGGWQGINLWLHRQMCIPYPSCSAVNDPNNKGGNGGYALDFMNRDGSLTILKKVPGDTRAKYAGATAYVEGGTYYPMAQTTFRPNRGQTYRLTGQSVDNGDGSTTLRVVVDGQVKLQVRDDGRIGGPRLGPGRVGLRTDYADVTVDNLSISH